MRVLARRAGIARPRDLLALRASLGQFPPFLELAAQLESPVFRNAVSVSSSMSETSPSSMPLATAGASGNSVSIRFPTARRSSSSRP